MSTSLDFTTESSKYFAKIFSTPLARSSIPRLPVSSSPSMAMNGGCGAPLYSLISTGTFASWSLQANRNVSPHRRSCPAIIINVSGHFRSKSSGARIGLAVQCSPAGEFESRDITPGKEAFAPGSEVHLVFPSKFQTPRLLYYHIPGRGARPFGGRSCLSASFRICESPSGIEHVSSEVRTGRETLISYRT